MQQSSVASVTKSTVQWKWRCIFIVAIQFLVLVLKRLLKLWYLFLTWLLVSTTVAKFAISQEYCDKQGHSFGFFTQKQANSSHFIDGMCKAKLLPLENVQCAQELGHAPFLNELQLLPPNHAPACQQLGLLSSAATHKKSWPVALKGSSSLQTQSVGSFIPLVKKNGNFLSRSYSHTLDLLAA